VEFSGQVDARVFPLSTLLGAQGLKAVSSCVRSDVAGGIAGLFAGHVAKVALFHEDDFLQPPGQACTSAGVCDSPTA
jgi:hypothetical protein